MCYCSGLFTGQCTEGNLPYHPGCVTVVVYLQDNALKAICPATLDVLLRVLWSHSLPGSGSALRDEEMMEVKQLILKCLVRLVHVLHNSSPEQVCSWSEKLLFIACQK